MRSDWPASMSTTRSVTVAIGSLRRRRLLRHAEHRFPAGRFGRQPGPSRRGVDRHGIAVDDADRAAVGVELDVHARAVVLGAQRHPLVPVGQLRIETHRRSRLVHPGEPEGNGAPHTAGRRHVNTVAGVAVEVGKIDEQRLPEVVHGEVAVTDLGGGRRLHAR